MFYLTAHQNQKMPTISVKHSKNTSHCSDIFHNVLIFKLTKRLIIVFSMHFQTPIKIVKKKNPQGLSDELVQIEINSSDQITLLIICSFKTGKRENGSNANQ